MPQIYWGLQPANLPTPASDFGICPPARAPSTSGVQTVWMTGMDAMLKHASKLSPKSHFDLTDCLCVAALYPAAQNAALQQIETAWPEVWGCESSGTSLSRKCEMNGRCNAAGSCDCEPGWRGPTCAALKLGPTPRESVTTHANPQHSLISRVALI